MDEKNLFKIPITIKLVIILYLFYITSYIKLVIGIILKLVFGASLCLGYHISAVVLSCSYRFYRK